VFRGVADEESHGQECQYQNHEEKVFHECLLNELLIVGAMSLPANNLRAATRQQSAEVAQGKRAGPCRRPGRTLRCGDVPLQRLPRQALSRPRRGSKADGGAAWRESVAPSCSPATVRGGLYDEGRKGVPMKKVADPLVSLLACSLIASAALAAEPLPR